ncbi:hypothetical protein Y1Q_0008209 [Alligator mississippiensis]|uniref:Uncharacterized protein n=1 Tax=Alligator mississippiensis TaxID=8496 RepID=A0A151N1D3_ALLMI|nr:hypothetical protein Y1Q_0008209 [Alligator mississippiensis]
MLSSCESRSARCPVLKRAGLRLQLGAEITTDTKDYMENNKTAVELKDAPSPHHASSKLFPAVPLPDVHPIHQQQIQLSPAPKPFRAVHLLAIFPVLNSQVGLQGTWRSTLHNRS